MYIIVFSVNKGPDYVRTQKTRVIQQKLDYNAPPLNVKAASNRSYSVVLRGYTQKNQLI